MNALEDKAAMATDASTEAAGALPRRNRKKLIGVLLCLSAIGLVAGGWAMALSNGSTSTDNAYVRGDVTSLAAKVPGYVTVVEVGDNQSVHAGDVLFRIDDEDYRAHLAQAEANTSAAQARLSNVDAETRLQRALIRQAEAQRRSAGAQMNLASKTHDRSRKLIVSNAVSQALVDETGAAQSKAAATVSAASASVDAQQQHIAVLLAQHHEVGVVVGEHEAGVVQRERQPRLADHVGGLVARLGLQKRAGGHG